MKQRADLALFAAAIGLGAFLLFQVQFILGKRLLPWFGGAPAVWTTCMLFFQLALLGGYAYAHALARRPAPRQRAVHLTLLLLCLLLLVTRLAGWPAPIIPGDTWRPQAGDAPIPAIIALLLTTIGLPFLALAATGPLLQSWYARLYPGASPYRLYALSNLGSLLGLGTYPFLIEPNLAIAGQGWLWSLGFFLYVLLCGRLALLAGAAQSSPTAQTLDAQPTTLNAQPTALNAQPKPPAADAGAPLSLAQRALWFVLAAIPSALLLAVTTQITLEVAVIPFLWMLPLALYLLTFILCFEAPRLYHRGLWAPLLLLSGAGAATILLFGVDVPVVLQLGGLLLALLAYCMVCHGELARRQPHTRHLTAYYLLIAAGGAAGGIFCGVVAPLAFLGLWELPLSLFAGAALLALLLTRAAAPKRRRRWLAPVFSAIYLIALGGALTYHAADELRGNLLNDRGFFGTLRIDLDRGTHGPYLRLRHGRITHGIQFTEPDYRHVPNSYYAGHSGVGLAADHHPRRYRNQPLAIGVIGLGTGTIATYALTGDRIRFYEIDPKVVALSTGDAPLFTYLRDSAGEATVALGDARLSLEREPPQGYDVLVVDAFSSDSIPAHLITVEAIELYLRHLRDDDGVIALHISNRYLDLAPLARGLAQRLDLEIIKVGDSSEDDITWASDWMLLSRSRAVFDVPTVADATEEEDEEERAAPYPVWTDTRSDLLEVLAR